tara:strand:- start:1312 stop:1485 length:174 start_codon:yes stop_codon:yes gene_type:complete
MKKKTSKKELEAKIIGLERKIDSYNVLFGMYVGFKGDDVEFQKHLKDKLEKKNGIVL